MALVSTQFASGSKKVICTHCRKDCEVALRAMSVFCPNCRKRLVLEDYRIKSYRNVRELATGGDIVVEKKGHVRAQIKVGNLTVRGKVHGCVMACGTVHISKTGSLEGDLEAPVLQVENGAVLNGFLKIGAPDPSSPVSAAGNGDK